ncbi:hypothetical protein ACFW1A_01280 [Kitasatospora sp. NPDC058965]|uniref:hypothetical protein n=1 Tax=Kitasatospora sp. NPDC058965 TaxID=3346682 RepID=UPI0036A86354
MTPLPSKVAWHDTGTRVFRYAARDAGHWWVLRLNDFPERPLLTLFIDARVVGDLDDPPVARRLPPRTSLPALAVAERAEVLRLMNGIGPYGAETGSPCTGDYCTCDILTDEYAARPSTPNQPCPPEESP